MIYNIVSPTLDHDFKSLNITTSVDGYIGKLTQAVNDKDMY
jgi:hypothetical protein